MVNFSLVVELDSWCASVDFSGDFSATIKKQLKQELDGEGLLFHGSGPVWTLKFSAMRYSQ